LAQPLNMPPDRNFIPRKPTGSTNEARFDIGTQEKLYPARRPMPLLPIRQPTANAGGFQGEYDKTKSYPAGSIMIISQALTIDGKTCPPGLIAVDPAYTDIYGNKFSGSLPANPTGANVPQSPLPTPGTVTNAARYIVLFCQSV